MAKKTYHRAWSPNRPERPEEDPIHVELMKLMNKDTTSVWEKANRSGLSTSTIYNWKKHKTKRPLASNTDGR